MGIGVGLFLIAVGAVLTWAVNATVSGVDINTVGVILMIVEGLGILLDLIIFAPRRRTGVDNGAADTAYGADEVVTTRRRTTI